MREIIIKIYIDEQKKSPRCEVKNKEIKRLTKCRICILAAVVQVVSVKVMDNLFGSISNLISKRIKKPTINFS